MATDHLWFVRAGASAAYLDDFLSKGIVGLGWSKAGKITSNLGDNELTARIAQAYPDQSEGTRRVWVSQIRRFLREPQIGDGCVSYDPERRLYFLGRLTSEPEWREGQEPGLVRRTSWTHQVSRDVLSAESRNSLGSIATFFKAPAFAAEELQRHAVSLDAPSPPSEQAAGGEPADEEWLDGEEMLKKAEAHIEDRIDSLNWQEMQELVAAVLRGMGYRTRVSEPGPDRGCDVFASPDGLGLEEPRIFVEVKHRSAPAGADMIRAFLGGRRAGDRCLFVSTRGFTKEARYEADRSAIPLTLVSLPELRRMLTDHYERLDAKGRALVPLQTVHWPLS
jgi:restriction system protein